MTEEFAVLANGRRVAKATITTRSRMILNLGLTYLSRRHPGVILHRADLPLSEARQIATELALTDEERAEAIEIAEGLEAYFEPFRS